MALSLCSDEHIVSIEVFDRGSRDFDMAAPDPAKLLWKADANGKAADPRIVTIGDDGLSGFDPSVPLKGALPEKLFISGVTTEGAFGVMVQRSDFRRTTDDKWWLGDKEVPISKVVDVSCPG